MKQLKKLGALVMALCLTVAAVACNGAEQDVLDMEPLANGDVAANQGPQVVGNGDAAGEQTTTILANDDKGYDPYEKILDENGNVVDMQGLELFIADWFYSESDPTSEYEVKAREWHQWLQTTYNFKVTPINYSTWGDIPTDYINYVEAGGNDECYIFTLPQGEGATQAMNKGYMYDLASLKNFDFTEDKWSKGILEYGTRGEKSYCMRGITTEPRTGVYFNKRILEEAGYTAEMMYDLQENGEWTWDKFEEICALVQRDFDNDGNIDQYACSSFSSYLIPCAVFSNGGTYINVDENGLFVSNLDSNEVLEGLTWAKHMMETYEMPQPEGSNWNYFIEAFENGQVAFTVHQAYQAGDYIKYCADDYGFLCFPRGPRVSDPQAYITFSEDNLFVIPSCYSAEKAEKIAFIYNQWTREVPGYEGYPAWMVSYYNNFSDSEAVELTLPRLVDSTYIVPRFENAVYGLIGNDGLHGQMISWRLASNDPAALLDEIRDTVQSYLDDHNGLN